MAHDLSGFAEKEAFQETCSYSLDAIAGAADALKAEGMTEADLSKAALNGEWGVIKGKILKGEFYEGQIMFTGTRTILGVERKFAVRRSFGEKPMQIDWLDYQIKGTSLTYDEFEAHWLHNEKISWSLGKAAKKLDVSPTSTSVGAMSDEDVAALFVKTKDALAQEKGILDLKGTNKALDDEVYDALAKETGYTSAEIKAKVNAYKASGKKLSALKKKVLKKTSPAPNGVPIQATLKTVEKAVEEVVEEIEASPALAVKVYQDEDVVAAYIKAKDDIAALESNPWTLYTQSDEFEQAIFKRMRDEYGITLDDTAIKKQIASYKANGNKISSLKKKLAGNKADPWVPKADTLKSKESSLHITTAGTKPIPPPPSFAGTPAATLSEFDISGLPTLVRDQIFQDFKSPGIYLTSTPQAIYDRAVAMAAKWGGPGSFDVEDALSVLKIVDERSALKFGLENTRPYEKRVIDWLGTTEGKNYVIAKKEAEYWLRNQPALPQDSSLFLELSTYDARAMQTEMGAFSASARDGLRTYTGNSYHEMNGYLRGKTRSISSHLRTAINNAKAGMKPVTRNFRVHRGSGFSQFGVHSKEELVRLVGQTVTDEGFVSTSVGGRAAFSGSVVMDIEVPRGAYGAYVRDISLHPGENEFLLAPGTKFRILRVDTTGFQTTVYLRVIV